MIIKPQPGFQEMALSTPADIAILGGSAGSGKSFLLLLEAGRHTRNPKYGAVIFRRTMPQITNEGSLWDTSQKLYPYTGGDPRESTHEWRFPSGSKIKFSHMEYEKNRLDWQGAQIPMIGFDELTHFTEKQFFYLIGRNRSSCGVRPYVRATCNPDPDSFVARFIEWWIDQETGYPIPERAGVLRYFTQDNGTWVWGDSPEEVVAKAPHLFNDERTEDIDEAAQVRSVTFIPGSIFDNKIFMKEDPGYLGALKALPAEEQAQLLDGNWKIRTDGLGLFDYASIKCLLSNYPDTSPSARRCITCDPARFGRDLCVIAVWVGWDVIHLSIFMKSDVNDIVNEIERLRKKFSIMKSNVLVDQDGVGDGTVKVGDYRGFHGAHPALKDPDTRIIEKGYANLKTQCYYRFAQRVNEGQVRLSINNETVMIFEDGRLKGRFGLTLKVLSKVRSVIDLIRDDFAAIKRGKLTNEYKLSINSKDEQKLILGRSPDFSDTFMMREAFELKPDSKKFTRAEIPTNGMQNNNRIFGNGTR